MKGLALAVVSVFCFGAVSSWADSPGTPGPTMYTLEDIYDYIDSGTVATEGEHSMEPPAGSQPGDTRFKTLQEIYELLDGEFSWGAGTTAANVELGHRFFCTNPGSWGRQTGTLYCPPTPTPRPTNTPLPTNTPIPTNTPVPTNTLIPTNTPVPTVTPTPTCAPGDWYCVYGPDGTGDVVQIGSMYVASVKTGTGCAGNGTKVYATAVSWGTGLNWLEKGDWRLPSKAELVTVCSNKGNLDSYELGPHWSSTNYDATHAWYVPFEGCGANTANKALGVYYVRAVRSSE